MQVFRTYHFDAAHCLTAVPEGHQCGGSHGHRFRLTIRVEGTVDPLRGWVVDFAEVDQAVGPLLVMLDHSSLNDIEGLGNPTSEKIAVWVWQELTEKLPGLAAVEVWESPDAGCVYTGR